MPCRSASSFLVTAIGASIFALRNITNIGLLYLIPVTVAATRLRHTHGHRDRHRLGARL